MSDAQDAKIADLESKLANALGQVSNVTQSLAAVLIAIDRPVEVGEDVLDRVRQATATGNGQIDIEANPEEGSFTFSFGEVQP